MGGEAKLRVSFSHPEWRKMKNCLGCDVNNTGVIGEKVTRTERETRSQTDDHTLEPSRTARDNPPTKTAQPPELCPPITHGLKQSLANQNHCHYVIYTLCYIYVLVCNRTVSYTKRISYRWYYIIVFVYFMYILSLRNTNQVISEEWNTG